MAYYSDIDHIRSAFFEKDTPEWLFYSGSTANKPRNRVARLIEESADGESIDESWLRLETALNRVSYKGGKATIFLGPKDGEPVYIMPVSLSKHTMTEPPVFATGGRGGYHGAPQLSGLRSFSDNLKDQMEIYDLKRRLEDMENSGGVWDQIGARIIEQIDPNVLVTAASNLITSLAGRPAPPVQTEKKTDTAAGRVGDAADPGDLEDKIELLMQTVADQTGGDEQAMKKLFDNLNEMIRKNPDIIKQLAQ